MLIFLRQEILDKLSSFKTETHNMYKKNNYVMFLPDGYMAQSSPVQLWLLQTPTLGMSHCETHAG